MRIAAIYLAIAGGFSGLIAAYYWYKSSKIPVDPKWTCEPVDTEDKALGWTGATIDAFTKSAELNKKAALWTAISVLLSALSGLCHIG
jgi:hypothetical protein